MLKLFAQTPRVAVATWADVLVSIWRADVEASDMKPAEDAQTALLREFPRYGSLAVAERGALRMSAEARHEAARITNLHKGGCCANGLVVPVEGFTGAAIRAAVTAVQLLSRSKTPQRSFDNVPAAARWVFEKLARDAAGLDGFLVAVEGLRTVSA